MLGCRAAGRIVAIAGLLVGVVHADLAGASPSRPAGG